MLFKQFTVVAIAALAASATAIPVTGSPTTTVIDPAVKGIALDPSMAVITHPSVPVNAGYADSNDDEENASKWGGGWGCWGWPSWGCWGWPNWCW